MRPMSEKQRKFILKLVAERKVVEQAEDFFGGHPSVRDASEFIGRLLAMPLPASAGAIDLKGIPSGRYAASVSGKLRFLKVDNVTEGKWAGYVFAKVQAGDMDYRLGMQPPKGMYSGKSVDYLKVIAADPKAASALYGVSTGSCGVCGRTLTDEVSLERGIGPICFKSFEGVM